VTGTATRKEWLTGWPLLASCAFGMSAPTVAHYTIGQFMAPLEAAYGWSRAQVSSGLSLSLLVSMLLAPLIGRTVDRVNVRPIALLGVILTGSCVASFSLATGNLRLWIALWTLHAVSASMASPVVWIAVIPSLFRANRSFATAVALAGTSLVDKGFSPLDAAKLAGIAGLATILGKIAGMVVRSTPLCGRLHDCYDAAGRGVHSPDHRHSDLPWAIVACLVLGGTVGAAFTLAACSIARFFPGEAFGVTFWRTHQLHGTRVGARPHTG
jgi:MFS transporter